MIRAKLDPSKNTMPITPIYTMSHKGYLITTHYEITAGTYIVNRSAIWVDKKYHMINWKDYR